MEVTGQKEEFVPNIFARKRIHAFRKYNVETAGEYEQKLQHMSTWDLAEEAGRHGLRPVNDRRDLIKTLVKEYQKAKSSFDTMDSDYKEQPVKTAREILAPFVR